MRDFTPCRQEDLTDPFHTVRQMSMGNSPWTAGSTIFIFQDVRAQRSMWRSSWASAIVPSSATSRQILGQTRPCEPDGDANGKLLLAKYINFALWVEGSSFTVGKPHLPSITTPGPDPAPMPTVEKEPEPNADRETQPMPTMEPVPAALSVREEKAEVTADQVCEPAITSVPVGLLVELEENDWLIDWSAEVTLPTHKPGGTRSHLWHLGPPAPRLLLGCSSPGLHFILHVHWCRQVSRSIRLRLGLTITLHHLSWSGSSFNLGSSLHQFCHESPSFWLPRWLSTQP